jgi:pimeloyl-ACP methyl ester carboxylesterase
MAKQTSASSTMPVIKDQYVIAVGLKLHYVVSGVGQPVVLLHGNDGTLQDFTMSIFNNLSTKYQTIAFDRPGHGSSETAWYKMLPPQKQASILHSALNKLGIIHPLLVAHSWSGALALSYALEFPQDLSGLVLLGSVAYQTEQTDPKLIYYVAEVPLIRSVAAFVFMITGKSEIKRQLEVAFLPDSAPQPYVQSFLASLFRLSQIKAAACDVLTLNPALKKISSRYSNIHMPVVIVTGDNDKTLSPEKHSYPLHKAIAQSKLIVVRNAGHELQFTHPDEVMSAIDLALAPPLKACIPGQVQQ